MLVPKLIMNEKNGGILEMGLDTNYDIPIALFTFKRLDTVKLIMGVLKEVKPAKLYIFSDGPRDSVIGEKESVAKVRQYIKESINWNCELHLVYHEANQGYANNIRNGFNKVLSENEMGIFLEDDAVPKPAFFDYVKLLLAKYKEEEKIQYIAGFNAIGDNDAIKDSYTFGHTAPMSGAIATWSDRWFGCDFDLKTWEVRKKEKTFRKFYFYSELYNYSSKEYDSLYLNGNTEWDIQFQYDMLEKDRFAIVPRVNLVKSYGNIDATHESGNKAGELMASYMNYSSKEFQFPMVEPNEVVWNREYDKRRQYIFLRVNGNYMVRHLRYVWRFMKDILYKYMPRKMWCFLRDLFVAR